MARTFEALGPVIAPSWVKSNRYTLHYKPGDHELECTQFFMTLRQRRKPAPGALERSVDVLLNDDGSVSFHFVWSDDVKYRMGFTSMSALNAHREIVARKLQFHLDPQRF